MDVPEVEIIKVETADDMENAVIKNCVKVDYIFMTAAVADYTPVESHDKSRIILWAKAFVHGQL